MRKLIIFLLLALTMLQATLAAAGSACLHERDDGVHHFGHHAHQHRGTATDHPAAEAGDLDHDCSTCHANALTGLPVWVEWPVLPEDAAIVANDISIHLSPPPPARPERPNWVRVA